MSTETVVANAALVGSPAGVTFTALLQQWCLATALLALQILLIIVSIMVMLEAMKAYKIIDRLVRVLSPVLKFLGLDRNVGMLWLAAALFGIAYCGAMIVEETRQGHYDREDLQRLHLSIGINHSMIEDPLLFLSLGLGLFWMLVPRLAVAIIAVQLFILFKRLTTLHWFSRQPFLDDR